MRCDVSDDASVRAAVAAVTERFGRLDILADSGLRAVIAPMFRDARWLTNDGHSLEYEWDHAAGRQAFDAACRLIERARQHPTGRLSGMVAPSQIDTCGADLLRDAHDHAAERNLPYQIHAAQPGHRSV